MPQVRAKFKGGKEVQFFVPEGTSQQQINSMAPGMYRLQQQGVDVTQEPEWDRSVLGHVGQAIKGVPRGAIRGVGSAATGLAQLLPEGAEVPTREFIQRATEAVASPFEPNMRYEDAMSGKFGEALGSTIPLIGASMVGGPVTGAAAATTMAGAMGSGEAIQRAQAAGATEEQISEAGVRGLVPGLGEMLVPFVWGRGIKAARTAMRLQETVGEEAAFTILDRIRRAGMAAGGEGAQEAASEIAQNMIARDIYAPDTDIYGGITESFGLGAGVGGFIQALVDLALPRGRGAGGAPPPAADGGPQPGRDLVPVGPVNTPPTLEGGDKARPVGFLEPPSGTQGELFSYEEAPPTVMRLPGTVAGITEQDLDDVDPRQMTIEDQMRRNDDYGRRAELRENYDRAEAQRATNQARETVQQEVERRIREAQEQVAQQRRVAAEAQQQRSVASPTSVVGKRGTEEQQDTTEPATRVPEREGPQPEQLDMGFPLSEPAPANPAMAQAMEAALRRAQQPAAQRTEPDEQPRQEQPAPTPTEQPEQAEQSVEAPVQPRQEAAQSAPVAQEVATPEEATPPSPSASFTPSSYDIIRRQYGERADEVAQDIVAKSTVTGRKLGIKDVTDYIATEQAATTEPVQPTKRPAATPRPQDQEMERAKPLAERIQENEVEPTTTTPEQETQPDDDNVWPDEEPGDNELEVARPISDEERQELSAGVFERARLEPERIPYTGNDSSIVANLIKSRPQKDTPKGSAAYYFDTYGIAGGLNVMAAEVAEGSSYSRNESLPVQRAKRAMEWVRNTPGLSDSMRRSLEREFSVEQERVAAAKRASRRVTPQKKKDTIAARRNTALNRELRQVERDTEDRAEAADADGEIRENQGQQADSRPAARRRERPDNALPIPKGLRRAVLLAVDADVGETIGEVVDRRASNYATAMSGLSRSNVLDPINLKRLSKQLQSQITGWMSTQELDLIEGNAKNRGELDIARRALMKNLLDFMSNPNISEEQVQSAAKVYADLRKRKLELKSSAIAASTQLLSEPVMSALEKGDLTAALESVRDEVGNKWVARIAEILSKNVGTTQVQLDTEIDSAGHFDPATNTIRINPAVGANIHTLLHEMTHAATSHVLSNPRNEVTQQLRKVYEQVKEGSPTYYGTQSLEEFVAEAWSNPEFQHMLENMGYMGSRKSVLRRVVEAVKNWFQSQGLFRAPGITNSPDIDELILSIVDAAPRSRAAPIMRVTGDMFGNTGYGINNKTREAFAPQYSATEAMSQLREALKYSGEKAKHFISKWILAAPQFVDAASPIIGEDVAQRFNNLIRDHSAMEYEMAETAKATAMNVAAWIEKVSDADRQNMNSLMARSTQAEVNPALDGSQYRGEKARVYRELRKVYDALPEGGQKLYQDMLKVSDHLYNESFRALEGYIRNTLTGETADAVVNKLAEKLKARKKKEPYFTLGRPHGSGTWVTMQTYVEDAMGDVKLEVVKLPFPSKRDAQAFIEDVRSDPQAYSALDLTQHPQAKQDITDSLEMPTRLDLQALARRAPDTSFVNTIFKILEGVDEKIQTQIMDTVLDYTSEQSVLKAFHTRKNVPGYGDMLNAFARNIQRTSRNIANLTYAREFYRFGQDMETWMKDGRGSVSSIKQRLLKINPIDNLQAFRDSSDLSDMEKSYALDLLDKMRAQGLTGAELQSEYRNGLVDLASEIQGLYNAVGTEMVSRARYAAAPASATWASVAKAVGFGWTLGLNVSSVIVNSVQVPAVTFPILGGEYGFKRSAAELSHAYKLYTTVLGMSRTQKDFAGNEVDMGRNHAPSLLNDLGDVTLMGRLKRTVEEGESGLNVPITEEEVVQLQELGKRLRAKGMLGHSIIEEQQELQERESSALTKVNNIMGKLFHTGERANREVSMIAAFRLEMDRLNGKVGTRKASERNLTEEQKLDLAAEKAMYISDFTHGSAHMRGRAKMAQTNIGNVLSMYKSYGAAMYYLLYKTANNMLAGESKEVRAMARRQMAGIFGMVGMMSGAAGLPMMGVIGMIHDFFKEDDEEDFKTLMRYHLGDLGTEGLLNSVTNLGFSERTSMSSLLYRASPVPNQDNKFYAFMEPLLGPTFGMLSRADRVTDLMGEGQYQRAFEAALPAFAASFFRAGRFATEGAQTMRGDPIDEDINAWNVLGQAFGLAPADYLRQLERNAAIKGMERAINTERSKLLEKYATARRFGDYESLLDIRKDMDDFTQRHPEFALTPQSINNSMRQRDLNSVQARRFNGLVLDKRFIERAMQMQRDFGVGFNWED